MRSPGHHLLAAIIAIFMICFPFRRTCPGWDAARAWNGSPGAAVVVGHAKAAAGALRDSCLVLVPVRCGSAIVAPAGLLRSLETVKHIAAQANIEKNGGHRFERR
jgi:hypothetical protein